MSTSLNHLSVSDLRKAANLKERIEALENELNEVIGAAPKAVEAARDYFMENAEAMAPRIAKSGRYLMGDQFCIADILLMTCLDWAVTDRIPLSDTLHGYRSRVAKRPAYQKALERNFPPRA